MVTPDEALKIAETTGIAATTGGRLTVRQQPAPTSILWAARCGTCKWGTKPYEGQDRPLTLLRRHQASKGHHRPLGILDEVPG